MTIHNDGGGKKCAGIAPIDLNVTYKLSGTANMRKRIMRHNAQIQFERYSSTNRRTGGKGAQDLFQK
jgi:hypothetical protein